MNDLAEQFSCSCSCHVVPGVMHIAPCCSLEASALETVDNDSHPLKEGER